MKRLGLIGKQLTHSFSKAYFEEKFQKNGINDYTYDLFPLADLATFPEFINLHPDLVGLNVTIPYKELIIPYLDELDRTAKETGAVNCIKIRSANGTKKRIGYNTDAFGFQQSVKPFIEPQHDKALIIGTGGAAKAVAFVLKSIGIECWFVSRENTANKEHVFTYEQINETIVEHFKLIVNATPVGMYPGINDCPAIPFETMGAQHLIYDVVYNPVETAFLKKARQMGAVAVNGLSMLYHQADKAWEIWTKE